MERIRAKLAPIQNIGLGDRTVRFLAGIALMAYGLISIALVGSEVMPALAIVVGVYPLLTAAVGWDPFYHLFHFRTCAAEGGRQQCGTLPYEVDAALGHNPKPEAGHEYDHSYTAAHPATHRPKVRPRLR